LAVFSAFWLFYFIIKLVFKKINSFGSWYLELFQIGQHFFLCDRQTRANPVTL
jgi:hypothetical protein